MEIVTPPELDNSIIVSDVTSQATIARFFGTDSERLIPYSVLITNESKQDVVGLAMQWIMTDREGQNRTSIQAFDSFGTNTAARQAVIPAGGQLIATPNGFKHVRPLPRSFVTGNVKSQHMSSFGFGRGYLVSVDQLDEAQRLMAVIDTIILQDGRVIGLDESHLADYIQATAVSLQALVNHVRRALSEGRNLDEILRDLVSVKGTPSRPSLRDDPVGFSLIKEADLLFRLRPEQRMGRLQQLESLRAPPAFYRVSS